MKNYEGEISYLSNRFDDLKTSYGNLFAEMYGFDYEDSCWTGNILCISDFYLDFYDVKYAVENDLGFDFLNKWYGYSLTVYENFHERVSLAVYKMGILPYKECNIEKLQKLQKEKNHIEAEIDDLINDMKKNGLKTQPVFIFLMLICCNVLHFLHHKLIY